MPTHRPGDRLHQMGDSDPMKELQKRTFEWEKLIEDPEVKAVIRAAVFEGISEGIRAHCRIPISDKEAQQVRFLFDNMKQHGDGDLHAGLNATQDDHEFVKEYRTNPDLRELKKDHEWVRKTRQRLDQLQGKVGAAVITAVVLFLLGLVGLGFKSHLFGGGQ